MLRATVSTDFVRVDKLDLRAAASANPIYWKLKFVVTNTLIVADVHKSLAFYRDVFGATVLDDGEPTLLRLGNIRRTINRGGGLTDDKPEVVASPPRDRDVLS